jgi:hypothetical protein
VEVVMAIERQTQPRPALIQISPDIVERLRDPRLVLALVAGIAGAIAVFVGYFGVSGTLDPAQQLPYLVSGGVGGLFLLGATLLFSTDFSATRNEVRQLREEIAELRALLVEEET